MIFSLFILLIIFPLVVILLTIMVADRRIQNIFRVFFFLITLIILKKWYPAVSIYIITIVVLLSIPILYLYKSYSFSKYFPLVLLLFCGLFTGIPLAIHYAITPSKVTKEDLYGKYSVDKEMFDETQAKWQHENFEISLDKDMYLRLYKLKPSKKILDSVKFEFSKSYSNRVILLSDSLNHHIIRENPTLIRKPFFKFHYVFHSEYYNNMFFEKQ